jgi:photosystem II stability/assembly factor-like uncharacterized protein
MKLLLVSFFSFFFLQAASGQWLQSKDTDSLYAICFSVKDNYIFAGTVDHGILRSSDNGTTWNGINNELHAMVVKDIIIRDSFLYAATFSGVFISSDNSLHWAPFNNGLIDTIVVSLICKDTILFAGTEAHGIFRSTDYGTSWEAVNTGLVNMRVHDLAVNGESIFDATFADGIFRSTDNGEHWIQMNNGFPSGENYITSFAVLDGVVYAGTRSWGVFRTKDDGENWSTMNNGLVSLGVGAFTVLNKNLFVGTGSGVSLAINDSTWLDESSGFPASPHIFSLASDGKYLFCGSNYAVTGVWRRPLSEMINTNAVKDISKKELNIESYPNPFTQSTSIKFSASDQGLAQILILNLLGSEVAQLFSGELDAGEHSFTWDTHDMPPGMYMCIVKHDERTEKLPLMLVK